MEMKINNKLEDVQLSGDNIIEVEAIGDKLCQCAIFVCFEAYATK